MKGLGQTRLQIRLFRVHIGWQPCSRPHVQPPAIKVKEEIDLRLRIVASIEPDDVVVLILNPYPAQEAHTLLPFPGLNVNHQAAYLAQKFAPNKIELVIALLEIGVEQH